MYALMSAYRGACACASGHVFFLPGVPPTDSPLHPLSSVCIPAGIFVDFTHFLSSRQQQSLRRPLEQEVRCLLAERDGRDFSLARWSVSGLMAGAGSPYGELRVLTAGSSFSFIFFFPPRQLCHPSSTLPCRLLFPPRRSRTSTVTSCLIHSGLAFEQGLKWASHCSHLFSFYSPGASLPFNFLSALISHFLPPAFSPIDLQPLTHCPLFLCLVMHIQGQIKINK